MRKLETDKNFALRGDMLQHAIDEDRAKGLVPMFVRQCLISWEENLPHNLQARLLRFISEQSYYLKFILARI